MEFMLLVGFVLFTAQCAPSPPPLVWIKVWIKEPYGVP